VLEHVALKLSNIFSADALAVEHAINDHAGNRSLLIC
jgi:hypothetical protein